jgi:ubiquinone/menaquinone biosynthesis C-methylase UbiE
MAARFRSLAESLVASFPIRRKPDRLASVLRRLYDATWGRVFARCYDWFLSQAEEKGLHDARRELLAEARGDCLEIGAGTGLNLDHWPAGVDRLVLTEPDPHMAARLRQRLAGTGRAVEVMEASGERLPFEDGSFDTVVVTLVLCTVPDVPATLREIERVLRPGGRLLFLEHVRADDARLARWQDRLHGPWYVFGRGCHCNRDTVRTIEASPLEVERVERGELEGAAPLVRPKAIGSAISRT